MPNYGDTPQTTAEGIENALHHRMNPKVKLTDNGRRFRGMTLLDIGRDLLRSGGVDTAGLTRVDLATRMLQRSGMHTTSDFSALLANAAGKRLRDAYSENPGTFRLWARRAPDATDFKPISVVQLSAMPDLLKVNEAGEFKYGQVSDGAETYSLATYGRLVGLSRQSLVNDDLRSFDRAIEGFASAAARLENRVVYAQLTANAVLADGVALFHASHGNLGTGAGSSLQFSALQDGRKAMRLQKGLQAEELNLAPAFLVVPSALEQTAYQLTSSQYTPATTSAINEFRAGGRTSLEPVVEPLLDAVSATAWYLTAGTGQVDTVEFCYLDGADAPQVDLKSSFATDGLQIRCRHDFAAKAVDYRGLYRGNGA